MWEIHKDFTKVSWGVNSKLLYLKISLCSIIRLQSPLLMLALMSNHLLHLMILSLMCFLYSGCKGTGWCLLCTFSSLLCRRNGRWAMGCVTEPFLRQGLACCCSFFRSTLQFTLSPIRTGPFYGSGCLPGFQWLRGFTPRFRWLHHPHS